MPDLAVATIVAKNYVSFAISPSVPLAIPIALPSLSCSIWMVGHETKVHLAGGFAAPTVNGIPPSL